MARQGRLAEDFACRYLQQRGLELLARNFHCRRGEIDLVMNDGGCIVFIEVRYRASARFGTAAETVDRRKQARLIATAQYYLQRHRAAARAPCRFDVITLCPGTPSQPLQWIRDAFQL